ncbi:TPA: hypothetical protein PWU90_000797 [Mannheimia haemolytica]|uniref:hypothetical protein n=1 Tax=Mannheimia haemolytica TaxID=75985 RepID=UPI00077EA877|nr:hypothetical protein [Mannheimia haemolytica]KYL10074.1 hypothetical protein AC568_04540 [Mannheimia haemolytica]UFK41837.1 hypothetical protein LO774_08825 [Mannheimia haemolytica]HDL1112637.1 hypothetical protein [Mannheimia haemolytica]HDL1115078.1 hypothetical protein [Mannheimia haemolytica]HDL1123237.1 hypothetical protein [Mannheimia haemolytica]
MKSKYLVDTTTFKLPEIDPLITAFVEENPSYWGSTISVAAIKHLGEIYRLIICDEGLTEWMCCINWLNQHGYTDITKGKGLNRYDAVFELVPTSN